MTAFKNIPPKTRWSTKNTNKIASQTLKQPEKKPLTGLGLHPKKNGK